jgi:hypothetical protein
MVSSFWLAATQFFFFDDEEVRTNGLIWLDVVLLEFSIVLHMYFSLIKYYFFAANVLSNFLGS